MTKIIGKWAVMAALATLVCVGAHATTHHYHAPKVRTYHHHAPKAYTPRSTVRVRGYMRHNGTYVMPSHRTSPNRTRVDNWSSRPNVNPYTGKAGAKDPYAPPSSGG